MNRLRFISSSHAAVERAYRRRLAGGLHHAYMHLIATPACGELIKCGQVIRSGVNINMAVAVWAWAISMGAACWGDQSS